MKKIFELSLFVVITYSTIFPQWVKIEKPRGGIVYEIENNGTNVFLSEQNFGVFSSTDGGSVWKKSVNAPQAGWFSGILLDGTNVFIGTENGLYRSTDNGINWHKIFNSAIGEFSKDGPFIIAATNEGLRYSNDNGNNWSLFNSPMTSWGVNSIAIKGSYIFAGCDSGIIHSNNYGINWIRISPNNYNTKVWQMTVQDSNLYAVCDSGILISNNFGSTWMVKTLDIPTHNIIYNILSNGSNVFAGTCYFGKGIYRSTDLGNTWQASNKGLRSYDILSLCGDDSVIIAGTIYQGIYKSTDQGETWHQSNDGLPELFSNTIIGAINNYSFFNLFGGTYSLSDNELIWKNISIPLSYPEDNIRSVELHKEKLFAGTDYHGTYSSSDGGNSWIKTNRDTANSIKHIESDDSVLIALTGSYSYHNLIRTTNDGTTWHNVNPGYINFNCLTHKGHIFYAGSQNKGVFLSTDKGGSWNSSNSGLTDSNIVSFAINYSYVFAGTQDSGVFVSTNNGQNWQSVNNCLGSLQIYQILANDSLIFALTFGGIYYSKVDEIYWKRFDQGIVGRIWQIGLTEDYLFAAHENGSLLKRPLTDIVTTITKNTESVSRFALEQNYPNPFNPVTTIKYSLPENTTVILTVFDVLGRLMITLVNEYQTEGFHSVQFDGKELSSGIYFYRLEANNFIQTRKLILVK